VRPTLSDAELFREGLHPSMTMLQQRSETSRLSLSLCQELFELRQPFLGLQQLLLLLVRGGSADRRLTLPLDL